MPTSTLGVDATRGTRRRAAGPKGGSGGLHRTLTLANLRTHSRRMISAGIAIVLGICFITTTLLLSSTVSSAIEDNITADLGSRAAVVENPRGNVSDQTFAAIKATDGVTGVTPLSTAFIRIGNPARFEQAGTSNAPGYGTLEKGRWPTKPGEVALAKSAATAHRLEIGSRTTVVGAGGADDDEDTRTAASATKIVGIVDTSEAPQRASVFAVNSDLASWRGTPGYDRVLVDGSNPESVKALLSKEVGPSYDVRTGSEQAAVDVDEALGDANILTMMLLAFAAVAMFVAIMVIGNTFSILLAQRTREMALLRCVGATRRQVLRSVIVESAVLGVVASVVGVLSGLVLGRIAVAGISTADIGVPIDSMVITPVALVAPLLVGIAVTMLAALRPAIRATRVLPLAALRPDLPEAVVSKASAVRIGSAATLLVVGAALMAFGATAPAVAAAIGGGMVSFVGVLLAAPMLVPALARGFAPLARRIGGVPGQLAVDNVARNPRRTAATTSALLVGVALIVAMAVAAATGRATVDAELDQRSPVDVTVTATEGALGAEVEPAIAAVQGVTAAVPVRGASIDVGGSRQKVLAIDPSAAAQVVRSANTLAGLRTGVVVIPDDLAKKVSAREGGQVRVGAATYTAHLDQRDGPVLLTPADLQRAAPVSTLNAIWVRLQDGADVEEAVGEIGRVTSSYPSLSVDGGASQRVELKKQTDLILAIAVGLLAIAVLIALVGVANTLGLSVLERRRESGLLRALGLTKRQLRSTIAWEALLIAAIGAGLGVGLGALYGYVGATALLAEFTDTVVVSMPWVVMAAVAAVAMIAGMLASVLPARRAARVEPSTALAAD